MQNIIRSSSSKGKNSALQLSHSKGFLPCNPVQILAMDNSPQPTFFLSSHKNLPDSITPGNSMNNNKWAAVGQNMEFMSFKNWYTRKK